MSYSCCAENAEYNFVAESTFDIAKGMQNCESICKIVEWIDPDGELI